MVFSLGLACCIMNHPNNQNTHHTPANLHSNEGCCWFNPLQEINKYIFFEKKWNVWNFSCTCFFCIRASVKMSLTQGNADGMVNDLETCRAHFFLLCTNLFSWSDPFFVSSLYPNRETRRSILSPENKYNVCAQNICMLYVLYTLVDKKV